MSRSLHRCFDVQAAGRMMTVLSAGWVTIGLLFIAVMLPLRSTSDFSIDLCSIHRYTPTDYHVHCTFTERMTMDFGVVDDRTEFGMHNVSGSTTGDSTIADIQLYYRTWAL